jgi:2-methylisocitrate lyase-like PEP mutase family enzyme
MAVSQAEKGARFRALHERGTFVIPNPYDIGSARILAALGFSALATTSAGFAWSLGRRDGAVTLEQALAHSRDLAGASDLPVSADLENGYADEPKAVAETVRRAAEAGLVGCSIEDATGDKARPIYDAGLAVERVAAAVEAARSLRFPFTLTARAENFLHGRPDLDDTIRRLQSFEKAGADVLYAPGLRDIDTVKKVVSAVAKPVNVLAGAKGLTVLELGKAGVRRISVGGLLARAAIGGLLAAAQEMKEKGTFAFAETAPTFPAIQEYMLGKE